MCIFITHSHVHTLTQLIGLLVCQESAGFTFQQNGPIWWANRCTRTPIYSYPCHHLSTRLNSAPSYPTLPANLPAHSGAAIFWLQIRVSVTSFVSDFISFYVFFFFPSHRNGGRTGHSDNLNHSVRILNVLQAKCASRNRCSANVLSLEKKGGNVPAHIRLLGYWCEGAGTSASVFDCSCVRFKWA